MLCTYHEPLSFEMFVLYRPPLAPHKNNNAASAPSRRASQDSIDTLLLEHDWLRRSDFVEDVVRLPPPKRRKHEAKHDVSDEEESEDDDDDKDASSPDPEPDFAQDPGDDARVPAADVQLELGAMMDAVAQKVDDQPDLFFKVVARGGQWTYDHTGEVADSVRGEARGELVKMSMIFSLRRYGREGAARLAKEFCRRGTHFFRMYFESDDPASFA